jgi:hypothetical protein
LGSPPFVGLPPRGGFGFVSQELLRELERLVPPVHQPSPELVAFIAMRDVTLVLLACLAERPQQRCRVVLLCLNGGHGLPPDNAVVPHMERSLQNTSGAAWAAIEPAVAQIALDRRIAGPSLRKVGIGRDELTGLGFCLIIQAGVDELREVQRLLRVIAIVYASYLVGASTVACRKFVDHQMPLIVPPCFEIENRFGDLLAFLGGTHGL